MNKAERVVEHLSLEITNGTLKPKQRLPSIRKASEDFGVSKNTIIEAYDKLVAEGLVYSMQGSGFFVADVEDFALKVKRPKHVLEAYDRISLLKAQLNQETHLRVGDGRPPLSWVQGVLPPKLSGGAISNIEIDQTAYNNVYGNALLREQIAKRYRLDGIQIDEDQIVTTFGANHALDLVIRRFIEPGDTVLVDDPGYYPLFAKLKLAKANIIGVPRTPKGPDISALRKLAKLHRPVLFFTQSRNQNPTGSSMDLPTAHSVLQIGVMYGIRIVDNDPFFDLPGQQHVPLALLDQCDNVIHISTYSKLVAASFRVGYIVASAEIVTELAELKLITAVNSSTFTEMITADLIANRRYLRHLKKTATMLEELHSSFNEKVGEMGLSVFSDKCAGLYSLLMLPAGSDESQIAKRALAKGIFLAPGKFFYVDEVSDAPSFRINMARADNRRFYQFLYDEFCK